MRVGNSASDFGLIARGSQAGPPNGEQPKRKTVAFALADAENLYIAIRCNEPAPAEMHWNTNNIVRRNGALPTGEDLVEIVLNPGRQAEGPAGLYHLLVKPNGVLIAQQGHGDASRPWPAGAAAATKIAQRTWTAELAIPLAAFGQAGRAKLWGIDFLRFATSPTESTGWSANGRYRYHPQNMGTMFISVAK